MATTVQEVMAKNPTIISPNATLVDAARHMRDEGIGTVLVRNEEGLVGLVTDRDIVVRGIANNRDPETTAIGQVCSSELVTVLPTESLDQATQLMREHALRRLPVTNEDNEIIGVVSIGDLAMERDQRSALAEISAQAPNT